MRDISSDDCAKILKQLKKINFFSGFSDDHITEFLGKCKLDSFEPNESIWRKDYPKLDFKILLSGCLIVWNDDCGEETTDALITAGQIIGEFEFLGKKSKSSKIKALTECELLHSTKANVEKLCEMNEGIFYRNLSKSLVDKIQFQNTLHKLWNFDSVDERLIYFLDNFTSNQDWQKFTDLKSIYDIEQFEINIFWTKEVLPGLLSTQMKTLAIYLGQHLSDGSLGISIFEQSEKEKTFIKDCVSSDFARDKFPKADFFKIKVSDYRRLTQDVEA
jgi:CRP-like cAMP-binding protein